MTPSLKQGYILVVAVSFLVSCTAKEMTRIRGEHGRSLTSSTLEWVDLQAGQEFPTHALPVTKDGPLWCRARQHATWASGAVIDGKCHFPFLRRIFTAEEFDVLVSVNDSARVIEVEWDTLEAIPARGILTPQMILALDPTSENDVKPGYVSPRERRAYFLNNDTSVRKDSALILTEDEPTHYTINRVIRDEDHSQMEPSEDLVGEVSLRNTGEEQDVVSETLDYAAKEIVYWGRVRGTITGLPAAVTDPSGIKRDLTWGIMNELDHLEQQVVEYELPPGVGVHVKLIAIMHKYEAPYEALLTAQYSDGVQKSRAITGLHIHSRLAELRAEYSKPYYLANNTELEGNFPTSEILMHSTTTTTTTTTTPPPYSETTTDEENPESNSIDTSDGGNKDFLTDNNDDSSASLLAPSVLLLLRCLLLFLY